MKVTTKKKVTFYTIRFTAKTYLFDLLETPLLHLEILLREFVLDMSRTILLLLQETLHILLFLEQQEVDDNVVTNLTEDVGTTTNILRVNDGSAIDENTYIVIDNESIYVDRKEGNTLFTKRAQDNTLVAPR